MRKGIEALFLLALAVTVLSIYTETRVIADPFVADYYNANFIRDTWALNGVSAIYLNYRVFDSIFETLILLASVAAVINFSWRQENE